MGLEPMTLRRPADRASALPLSYQSCCGRARVSMVNAEGLHFSAFHYIISDNVTINMLLLVTLQFIGSVYWFNVE